MTSIVSSLFSFVIIMDLAELVKIFSSFSIIKNESVGVLTSSYITL